MSQRTSGTCGLFSRAEDKLKLSDDVIEKVFTRSASSAQIFFLSLSQLCKKRP